MALRPVKGYHVRHTVGQTSLIVLTYEGGEKEQLPALTVAEAQYITDLLRNESPIWYDAAKKELCTGIEPVGEGE